MTLGEMHCSPKKEELFTDLFFPEENRVLFERMRKAAAFRQCGSAAM